MPTTPKKSATGGKERRRLRAWLDSALVLGILCFAILSARAASPSGAPAGSNSAALPAEEVFACDFEDAADADYDGWPDGWTRRRSREMPEFIKVGIVSVEGAKAHPHRGPLPEGEGGKAAAGNRCLLIDLDGGGAVVSSQPFAVSSQFSLMLTLRVKVEGLVHDGAWATLSLVDAAGNTVQSHSGPPLSTAGDWQTIRIGPIAAINNKVVRGVVSLTLSPLGKREDLTGRAWFDDIRIVRVPRMSLEASIPTAVFTGRDVAEVVCEASGICVHNPQVRFELFDHTGSRLAEHHTSLLTAQEQTKAGGAVPPDGFAGHASWTPPLPGFGFYRVRASLFAKDSAEVLLDREQSLVLLRPLAAGARGEFGWSLSGKEQPFAFGPLATLLKQAGLGWAKMPVWYDPSDTAQADRIAWFAEQLSIQGIELVGVLDQPPSELREVFRDQGRLAAASVFSEPALWQPAVGPVMTRLSLKVRWWQLGDDSDVSFIGYPRLEAKVAEIKRHLEQYGQQIHVGLNWRWVYAPPAAGTSGAPWAYLLYDTDPPLTADELAAHLQAPSARAAAAAASATTQSEKRKPDDSRERPVSTSKDRSPQPSRKTSNAPNRSAERATRTSMGGQRWILLAPLPRDEYSMEVRVHDLVTRMLAAKVNGADAVFVPQPFSDEQGVMNTDGSPGPLLVPWRTTAALVGGSEYLGLLQLPGGSMSYVFAQGGRAVMAVWSDRPTTEHLMLSDEIEQIDVWGRPTKPLLVEREGRQARELKVTTLPTFVTGLSEAVARWQAAIAFENSQLSSVTGRLQTVVLRLPNTFKQSVNGELVLNAPKSWEIDPRPTRFKIAEGEVLRLPLPVTLQADANSGPQPVRLDFEVAGYRFSVYRTLQLGLDDVQVELTTRLKDGRLWVEQHLSNLSDRPLSFQCVLFAPDRRRETRQVLNLGRERTTLTFVLPRGEELIGKKLWLRAEEISGSRVLNYTLIAER